MDGGAWWAVVHGVTRSWTRLSDFTFTFHFHALAKEMATHSSIIAWEIPLTEDPGRLQSMGQTEVTEHWYVQLNTFKWDTYHRTGEGNGIPLQDTCLENPMDGGAWSAAVHGVAKSQTRLSDFTFTFLFHALEKEMTIFSHSEGCLFTLLIVSYTKETRIERDTCTPMFIAALFIISSNLNVNQQTNG